MFADEPLDDRKTTGPVECLGLTFENDAARRAFFLEKLREKLADPEFRAIEGFPLGSDADILALSDPPYYTACPNPFLEEFVRRHGKPYDSAVGYSRKPFAVDVSEGKTDPLYKAHSYHTKVPHLAIVPSILHYTEPGEVVLDGFCGSGMTGVAAQWCGSAPAQYRQQLETLWKNEGLEPPCWGARRVVLNDLSPAATFIAANYNLPFEVRDFARAGRKLLDEVAAELGWMYETRHSKEGQVKGRIEYTVWSEVFACPTCGGEVVFLDEALDQESKRVRETFPCPHCTKELNKDNLERVLERQLDPALGESWQRVKFRPSLIVYDVGGKRFEKQPEAFDLELLDRIRHEPYPPEVPTNRFPIEAMYHGSRIAPKGFTHVHHFFLPRAAHALAALWRKANAHPEPRTRNMLVFFVEQAIWGMSVLARYTPTHFSQVNQYLTGVYYVASQHAECSPWYILEGKLERLIKVFTPHPPAPSPTRGEGEQEGRGKPLSPRGRGVGGEGATVTTGSAARLNLPDDSIDYIFTDPPFGENIYYADLNFLVESWHRVTTDAQPEAIVDRFKQKAMPEYQELMRRCFTEYCRVLKPGRWMTVVFHNSKNAVWNAIQEAMGRAGFIVADVRTLDKQQGSYRQVTSTAVKQDLVISAYKPNGGLEARFKLEAGSENGVWDFVRTHLKQLPLFVARGDEAEVVAERLGHLLYDRMVAFHVQRGVLMPMSAAEFYQGLSQRFDERDQMYFLAEQSLEYDRRRLTVKKVRQLTMFITDEASAIQWLKRALGEKPRTYQELYPEFIQEVQKGGSWRSHEKPIELADLLEQNFLCYEGHGEVPAQLHSYLSTNFKELRNLEKNDPTLQAKARERWYVPDPNKAADLEKVRERALLREFETYRDPTLRKLKLFRFEAVRAGFKKSWGEKQFGTIVEVAKKIPEAVLEEDPKLIMWYDQAVNRVEEGQ
ncbi:MAG: DNA methylase [Magnetococcales bacterium]|nr:DNA methylase [Magnetococcales bacterium]